ncbi:MAG TPA: hypothetical protein P5191_04160 [Ruminococcus sp.]|nr:hypothetical protein [Ruminococcus sp.]
MKKVSTYLPSLILSIFLVLALFGSLAMTIFDINVTAKKAKALSEKKELSSKVITQLNKHYREQAAATGIPANVFMDNISEEYIDSVIDAYIDGTFTAMKTNRSLNVQVPKNPAMEEALEKFFGDYADSIGYEKNEAFYRKLDNTKTNAYKNIGSCCDVFKASSLGKHGLLSKASKLYRLRPLLTFASVGGAVLLMLFILAVNWKDKRPFLYWTGIAAVISGIFGTVPSIYLVSTKYFDSFSIKQPQVFTAYTASMYRLTEAFMAVSISLLVIGIALIVIYGVSYRKNKRIADSTHSAPEKNEADTN